MADHRCGFWREFRRVNETVFAEAFSTFRSTNLLVTSNSLRFCTFYLFNFHREVIDSMSAFRLRASVFPEKRTLIVFARIRRNKLQRFFFFERKIGNRLRRRFSCLLTQSRVETACLLGKVCQIVEDNFSF